MKNIEKKTALITGGAQGIGYGCALALAKAGINIIINDLPGHPNLSKVKEEIEENGVDCKIIELDIFKPENHKKLINQAKRKSSNGEIDILICCAYKSKQKPFRRWKFDEFLEITNAVYLSHLNIAKHASEHMITFAIPGNIIFMSSVYGSICRENSIAYDAAKAAIDQASKVMARELAKHNIRVNAIAPGFTITPGEEKFANPEEIRRTAELMPLGKACTPIDIGETALFIIKNLSITGQVITIDNGHSLPVISYKKIKGE